MQDLAKAIMYVVSDDGHTPVSMSNLAAMLNGGTKLKDISIFTDKDMAQAEYARRCVVNEVISKIKGEEHEVIKVIDRAVVILMQRNSDDQQVRDRAKILIDLLNAAEVSG